MRGVNMAAKPSRQKRQYIKFSEQSTKAMIAAIDSFNRVYGDYKTETTLLLLSNGWELLAKAVLLKKKQGILKAKNKTETISCEVALRKLFDIKEIDQNQSDLLQQIVSLRNQCTHDVLPHIPEEIQHHLLFFGCKFYKDLCKKHFPKLAETITQNFLTLSFDSMTTYATEVQKLISKLRKGSTGNKELVWLLERGVRYTDTNTYLSQAAFERLYKEKKKIMPHLKVASFLEKTDMIRVVPVQAPKNFTADINLKHGSKGNEALGVHVHKDSDYQFFTEDVAKEIGKDSNFVARTAGKLKIKGDPRYHTTIKTSSKSSGVPKYNQAAIDFLKDFLRKNPNYSPYK